MICLFSFGSYADVVVRGIVYDSEKHPLGGIMVRLHSNGKPKAFTTSAPDGSFRLSVKTLEKPAYLKFLSQKFDQLEFPLDSIPETIRVYLQPKDFVLQEVVVRATERRIKGDTIHYDVSALTKVGDRTIEDVIKKIPGVEVDDAGSISYDGKPLKHFYIEDLDLLGRNYAIASKSINPADISTISVYERHQDKRVLQGKEVSDKASLNLKLKKGRMLKPIGYLKAGAGIGDEALWNGELYGMLVSPKVQTIISAKGDNDGHTFGSRKDGSSFSIFSPTPFGEPSIKQDRFLDNLSAFASANSLFKLKKDLIVKLNTSYSRNEESFNGESLTEYLNPESESILYAEEVGNKLNYQSVNVSANIENNGKDLYFNDTFDFNGNFSRNNYDVTSTTGTGQRLSSDNYNFSNQLKTIIHNRGKLYQIDSETSYRNTPASRIAARDLSSGDLLLSQLVKLKSFHNKENTSFSWLLNTRFTIGTSLSFEIDHDKFASTGVKNGGKTNINDLSGYKITTSAEPFF